ncbi:MAG: hypothetical protein V2A74_01455 [bacterium]
MPLLSGSLTSRSYRVLDPIPKDFRSAFLQEIRKNVFHPPAPEKGEMHSAGWVNPRNPLDTALNWEKILFSHYMTLALRVDRLSVNPRLFRPQLMEAISRVASEKKRTLTRAERLAIAADLRVKILKRQTPSTAIYEAAWNVRDHRVHFSASGEKINLTFQDFFTATFGVRLDPMLPYVRAEDFARRQKLTASLESLSPDHFSPYLSEKIQKAAASNSDDEEG